LHRYYGQADLAYVPIQIADEMRYQMTSDDSGRSMAATEIFSREAVKGSGECASYVKSKFSLFFALTPFFSLVFSPFSLFFGFHDRSRTADISSYLLS
jgi:hypothetical protein